MALDNIKIAFFDIDGTLLALGQRDLTPDTRMTLQKLQENGILICVATGRGMPSIPKFSGIDWDVYLTYNGSLCFNKNETIASNPLKHEDVIRILENTKKMNRPISISKATMIVKNGHYPDLDEYFEVGHVNVDTLDSIDELCEDEVYQINIGCSFDEYPEIMEGTTSTKVTSWWGRASDFIPTDGGKGLAIDRILNYYGFSKDEAVAFGDGNNDIEMLQSVGHGVAMGNANDTVKASAEYVCKSVDEDGIFCFCEEHGLI